MIDMSVGTITLVISVSLLMLIATGLPVAFCLLFLPPLVSLSGLNPKHY